MSHLKGNEHLISRLWIAIVAAFTLAAATGALFRFGSAYGITFGLNLVNVRHAHTHLMFFSWVIPAAFLLISARITRETGRPAPKVCLYSSVAALILGLASYVPYLLFGYTPIQIGSLSIPPSVILAALNMFAWYGFAWGYLTHAKGVERTLSMSLFDAAILFLMLSSLGAWGISILTPLGLDGILWPTALAHIFLDYFSEGWLLFAVLGLAMVPVKVPVNSRRTVNVAFWMLIGGTAVSFLLGMPRIVLSTSAQMLARVAGSFMALGLLAFLVILWRNSDRKWRVPLAFLSLKTMGLFLVSVTPLIWWSELYGERILYLHTHLLGFVSLGILAAASSEWGTEAVPARAWMNRAVMLVIASLFPMTVFWLDALRGIWPVYAMAWVALGPVLVGLIILSVLIYRQGSLR